MLATATFFLSKLQGTPQSQSVDRLAVLEDIYECETWLLERKVNLLNCYREAYEHSVDSDVLLALGKQMLLIMEHRPCIDTHAPYFVSSYTSEIVNMELEHSLTREVLVSQVALERKLASSTRGAESLRSTRGTERPSAIGLPFPAMAVPAAAFQCLIPGGLIVAPFELITALSVVAPLASLIDSTVDAFGERFRHVDHHLCAHQLLRRLVLQDLLVFWRLLEEEDQSARIRNTPSVAKESPPSTIGPVSQNLLDDPVAVANVVREASVAQSFHAADGVDLRRANVGDSAAALDPSPIVKAYAIACDVLRVRESLVDALFRTEILASTHAHDARLAGMTVKRLQLDEIELDGKKAFAEIDEQDPIPAAKPPDDEWFFSAMDGGGSRISDRLPVGLEYLPNLAIAEIDSGMARFDFSSEAGLQRTISVRSGDLRRALYVQLVQRNLFLSVVTVNQAALDHFVELSVVRAAWAKQPSTSEISSWPTLEGEEIDRLSLQRLFLSANQIKAVHRRTTLRELSNRLTDELTDATKADAIRKKTKLLKESFVADYCVSLAAATTKYMLKGQAVLYAQQLRNISLENNELAMFTIGGKTDVVRPAPSTSALQPGEFHTCMITRNGRAEDLRYIPHMVQLLTMEFDAAHVAAGTAAARAIAAAGGSVARSVEHSHVFGQTHLKSAICHQRITEMLFHRLSLVQLCLAEARILAGAADPDVPRVPFSERQPTSVVQVWRQRMSTVNFEVEALMEGGIKCNPSKAVKVLRDAHHSLVARFVCGLGVLQRRFSREATSSVLAGIIGSELEHCRKVCDGQTVLHSPNGQTGFICVAGQPWRRLQVALHLAKELRRSDDGDDHGDGRAMKGNTALSVRSFIQIVEDFDCPDVTDIDDAIADIEREIRDGRHETVHRDQHVNTDSAGLIRGWENVGHSAPYTSWLADSVLLDPWVFTPEERSQLRTEWNHIDSAAEEAFDDEHRKAPGAAGQGGRPSTFQTVAQVMTRDSLLNAYAELIAAATRKASKDITAVEDQVARQIVAKAHLWGEKEAVANSADGSKKAASHGRKKTSSALDAQRLQSAVLISEIHKELIKTQVAAAKRLANQLEQASVEAEAAVAAPPEASRDMKQVLDRDGIFSEFAYILLHRAVCTRDELGDRSSGSTSVSYQIPEASLALALDTVHNRLCVVGAAEERDTTAAVDECTRALVLRNGDLHSRVKHLEHQAAVDRKALARRVATSVADAHYELIYQLDALTKENRTLQERSSRVETTLRQQIRSEYQNTISDLQQQLTVTQSQFKSYQQRLYRDMQVSLEEIKRNSMLAVGRMESAPLPMKRQALHIAISDDEINSLRERNNDLKQAVLKTKLWYEVRIMQIKSLYEKKMHEVVRRAEDQRAMYFGNRLVDENEKQDLRRALAAAQAALSESEIEVDQLRTDLQVQVTNKKELVSWKVQHARVIEELTKKLKKFEKWGSYDIDKLLSDHERRLQEQEVTPTAHSESRPRELVDNSECSERAVMRASGSDREISALKGQLARERRLKEQAFLKIDELRGKELETSEAMIWQRKYFEAASELQRAIRDCELLRTHIAKTGAAPTSSSPTSGGESTPNATSSLLRTFHSAAPNQGRQRLESSPKRPTVPSRLHSSASSSATLSRPASRAAASGLPKLASSQGSGFSLVA